MDNIKVCGKCKNPYDKSFYHKNRSKKDGLCTICKKCKIEEVTACHYFKKPLKNKDCEICNKPLGKVNSKIKYCSVCKEIAIHKSKLESARKERLLKPNVAKERYVRCMKKDPEKAKTYYRTYLSRKNADEGIYVRPTIKELAVKKAYKKMFNKQEKKVSKELSFMERLGDIPREVKVKLLVDKINKKLDLYWKNEFKGKQDGRK